MGVALVLIYPCGKAWKNPPFLSRFIVSDRSSPSRVRFAASRPGRLRADPKDALLTRGKGGYRSDSYFVSHLIAFDSIAPHPKSGVFGSCGRAERGSALELVGRVSLFQGSFSPVAGFSDQMPGLLVGVAAVAEKLRYAADVPGSEYSFSLPGLIS